MTAEELIRQFDETKPNGFTRAQKLRWLGDMEAQLWTETLLQSAGDREAAMENGRRLLLPERERRLYEAWLGAMIDLANGEYAKYAASMSLYNSYAQSFAADYARVFRPADRAAFWTRVGVWTPTVPTAALSLPAGYGILGAICRVTERFDEGTVLSLGLGEDEEALLRKVDIIPESRGAWRQMRLHWPCSGAQSIRVSGTAEGTQGRAEFFVLLQPSGGQ